MTEEAIVQLINTVKVFDGHKNAVVNDVSLEIKKGEFLTILGPSGCGKTTTLRMIAGFENLSSGKILIDNEDVSNIPPYKRSVNTVFQNYALFPHMNIFDNIAFGLVVKKMDKEQVRTKVLESLKMIQMEGYENRMPHELSGGQKQRVAIARAIVNNPKVLLLDEPLGALDLKLRKQMQFELKRLQRKLGITFIYVTHDQEEALTMSDRIVVMNKGQIEQIGTPDMIYEKPKTKFVADFIGETNIFEGCVAKIGKSSALLQIDEEEKVKVDDFNLALGEQVYVAIRPERVKLKYVPEEGDAWLQGKLKERIYAGAALRTVVMLKNGNEVLVNEPVGENFQFTEDKQEVFITWNPKNAVVMRA